MMDFEEVFERLEKIGDVKYEISLNNVEKEELVDEALVLKDAFMDLYESRKALKEDNERLRKMVQQIYEAFKRKALKYIVNSSMNTKDLNLFKEIFSTYLK